MPRLYEQQKTIHCALNTFFDPCTLEKEGFVVMSLSTGLEVDFFFEGHCGSGDGIVSRSNSCQGQAITSKGVNWELERQL